MSVVLISIAIGYTLTKLPRYVAILVVTIFVGFNVLSTITLSEKYGLNIRRDLVKKTMTVIESRSYELRTFGELPKPQFSYAGWRYLFKHYGQTPAKSNIDIVLGWIYPDEISEKAPELLVIASDLVEPKFSETPIAIFKYGVYRSYIFHNKPSSYLK